MGWFRGVRPNQRQQDREQFYVRKLFEEIEQEDEA
jgi:hypothetical protein